MKAKLLRKVRKHFKIYQFDNTFVYSNSFTNCQIPYTDFSFALYHVHTQIKQQLKDKLDKKEANRLLKEFYKTAKQIYP